MSSRTGIKHFTQPTQPATDMQVGDEWFNTSTNRLYKFMVQSGTTPTWVELFNSTASTPYTGPAQQLYYVLQGGYTGFNNTGVQPIFGTGATALGIGVRLSADTMYQFEMNVTLIKTAGTTSHTISTAFGGTANLNFIYYQVQQSDGNGGMNTRISTYGSIAVNTAAATVTTGALTAATQYYTILVKGMVSVRTAGTFIPQYSLSAAPGGSYTTQPGSYIFLTSMSTSTGTWA